MLRAVGDMNGVGAAAPNILSVISPLGLGLQVKAFYTNAFWPVLVLLAEGVVIGAIALLINARRDVGMGVFPARKGRAHAARGMCTPLGFSWRLLRNTLLAWAVGLFLLGAAYGTVVGDLKGFIEGNSMIQQMIEAMGGKSLTEGYVTMLSAIMGMLVSVPLIVAMNRLRAEEKRGRLDQILSKAVSRERAYLGYLCVAVLASLVFPFLIAVGFYAAGASSGELNLPSLLQASYVYLPAQLVMIGISAFLIGWFPKLLPLNWVMFAYSFIMVYFGRSIFKVPEAFVKISPFGSVPQLPAQELEVAPLIVLCVIAVALMAAGLVGYRRRDISAV